MQTMLYTRRQGSCEDRFEIRSDGRVVRVEHDSLSERLSIEKELHSGLTGEVGSQYHGHCYLSTR